MTEKEPYLKYMGSMTELWTKRLRRIAKKRGITLQELLRACIIPEWYSHQPRETRQ